MFMKVRKKCVVYTLKFGHLFLLDLCYFLNFIYTLKTSSI